MFGYFMAEIINESVSVDLLSNHLTQTVLPWIMKWNGRKYTMTNVGLHYTTRAGRALMHYFSVTDGKNCFKLEFDTENLGWRLLEIENSI
jgi:hypothetical protein